MLLSGLGTQNLSLSGKIFYYSDLFIYIDMRVFLKIELGEQNSYKKSQNSTPSILLFPCASVGGGSEIESEVEPREKRWKEGVLIFFLII